MMDLDRASAVVPFKILVPDHPLASTASLKSVEWCPGVRVLVLSFESGVRVELSPSQITDPAEDFAAQAEANPGVTVGTIRGVDAVFVEPGATGESSVGSAPGGVEFIEDSVLIDVVGDGNINLGDLKAIAESLNGSESST
jgi:hypothetical protein